jgi:hypothetical protein
MKTICSRCPEMTRNGTCFGNQRLPDGKWTLNNPIEAAKMLAMCRPSCRREYEEKKGKESFERGYNIYIF